MRPAAGEGAPPGPRSIAFGGAVFGWPYYAGVAAYLQAHAVPIERVYGTSSGAVVGALLACGVDAGGLGLELGLTADRAGLGWRRSTAVLRPRAFRAPHVEALERALPADAHVRATGRLYVVIRRVRAWRRVIVSEYPTRADLVDALLGAIAVPGLTVPLVHWSPRHGAVIDGGPGAASDDRPGAVTVRVGVRPGRGLHIAPAAPFQRRLLLAVAPDAERRAMFERGRADAAAYFAAAG